MLAAGAVRVLLALDPTSLPPLVPVRLDWIIVAFTVTVGVAVTLAFGLVPALRSLRINLVESLREGSQQATAGAGRQRVRGALVVAEMSLAVVLVIAAGLMARSLGALGRVPLGFDPAHALTLRLALPASRYDTPEKVVDFYRRLLEHVRGMNGVTAAGVVRALPLATSIGDWGLDIEGYVESPGQNAKGDWQVVSDGAFEAMGARLVRGRWFTPADTSSAQRVMVVNETMARTYWPNGEAVGGRVRVGGGMNRIDVPPSVVVGIVADERHNGVTAAVKEKFYVPHSQWHVVTSGNLVRNAFVVVRTTGDPMSAAGPVREAIRGMDPALPVANVRAMTDVVATAWRRPADGVLAGRVRGHRAGAGRRGPLRRPVVPGGSSLARDRHPHGDGRGSWARAGDGAAPRRLAGAGRRGVGLVCALGASRLMRGLLFEVGPADPVTFVLVPVFLLAVAALASLVPALRAVRVNPTVALRME